MFHAWLVKMRKMQAISAPATRPGVSDRKNTMVMEKLENGQGLQYVQQRHQHNFRAATLRGQRRVREGENEEATIAMSMRSAVRAA